MSVAVVQKHEENIDGIKEIMSHFETDNQIFYSSFPSAVLKKARETPFDLVIGGGLFCDPISDGKDFAREMKRLDPTSFFIMYSTMAEQSPFIDGYIPKPWGTCGAPTLHGSLIPVLTQGTERMFRERDYWKMEVAFPHLILPGRKRSTTWMSEFR
ncbi:MAG: hypothetical protein WCK90_02935 [archaeon]